VHCCQDIVSVCVDESRENAESKVFVLCILSHGHRSVVYGVDGVDVSLEQLEMQFDGEHCGQLVGRPKLFLIQACQGGVC